MIRPIIFGGRNRQKAIRKNDNGVFHINQNPDADAYYGSWRANPETGMQSIKENDSLIDEISTREHVDPDLVRSIMYLENSHGGYDFIVLC